MNEEVTTLHSLAQNFFGELSEAEGKLLSAIETKADPHSRLAKPLSRNEAKSWPRNREIRASLISWLCTDLNAQEHIDHHGISIREVRITESLNLTHAKIPFPIRLMRCLIAEDVLLCNCNLPFLRLTGSCTQTIIADGLRVDDLVDFSGLDINGELTLRNARIGGILRLNGTKIRPSNRSLRAIEAYQAKIGGTVFMESIDISGCLSLVGVKIDGDLRCHGAMLSNEGSMALDAYEIKVDGSLYLCSLVDINQDSALNPPCIPASNTSKPFHAIGEVYLVGAMVSGVVECDGGTFSHAGRIAFNATAMVARGLFLRNGCLVEGSVNILGSRLSSNLECQGGAFLNPGNETIRADGIRVDGHTFLKDGFRSEGEVSLKHAQIGGNVICDRGCFINPGRTAIHANELSVTGDMLLRDAFEVQGQISLEHANIQGSLELYSGNLHHTGHIALNAIGIRVDGYICLKDGLRISGGVSLIGATVKGAVECDGAELSNPGDVALDGTGLHAQTLLLRAGCRVFGEIRLVRASLVGSLVSSGGYFDTPSGTAINAVGLITGGGVFFQEPCEVTGTIILIGASIGNNLDFTGAHISGKQKALDGDGINVAGHVYMRRGFCAEGEIRFPNGIIGGDMDFTNAALHNELGTALECEGLVIKGNLLLCGTFVAHGKVGLLQASVGRFCDCTSGLFSNPNGTALEATRIAIRASLRLCNNFRAEGGTLIRGADIGLDLLCDGGAFLSENSEAVALDASRITVQGDVSFNSGFNANGKILLNDAHIGSRFVWKNVGEVSTATLDMRGAIATQLDDDLTSWEGLHKNYYIARFTYDVFADGDVDTSGDTNRSALTRRLQWLKNSRCNRNRVVAPMPYEQLASVYERMGHQENAVIVRSESKRGRYVALDGTLNIACKATRCMSGYFRSIVHWFIGYGYRPLRPVWFLIIFFLLGTVIFYLANKSSIMVPAKERVYMDKEYREKTLTLAATEYPRFNEYIYSLDTLLPFVNLYQEDYWLPDSRGACGAAVRYYLWFHVAVGWIFGTFVVYGVTSLIKRK